MAAVFLVWAAALATKLPIRVITRLHIPSREALMTPFITKNNFRRTGLTGTQRPGKLDNTKAGGMGCWQAAAVADCVSYSVDYRTASSGSAWLLSGSAHLL